MRFWPGTTVPFCERRIFSTRIFSSWREVDEKRGILARDEERHLGRKVSSISFPFVFTSVKLKIVGVEGARLCFGGTKNFDRGERKSIGRGEKEGNFSGEERRKKGKKNPACGGEKKGGRNLLLC